MSTSNQAATEAVQRKDWRAAYDLYQQALVENEKNETDPLDPAKNYGNLSFVLLKLERYDEAIQHALRSTQLAPTWGKAHARLGAALEASGCLLEAQRRYQQAKSLGCTDCEREHDKLKQNPRFRKLHMIHRATETERVIENRVGTRIQLPANDPAIEAMNEEQLEILRMIEQEGRVLPESTTPEETLRVQDLILYLAAVDASITLRHVPVDTLMGRPNEEWDVRPRGNPTLCPGTRQWILGNSNRNFSRNAEPDHREHNASLRFNMYNILFHSDQAEVLYEKTWVGMGHDEEVSETYGTYTIKFQPNQDVGSGPTATIKRQQFLKNTSGDWQYDGGPTRGVFLMGLRQWIMIQCRTDVLPERCLAAFQWDSTKQKLVTNISSLRELAYFNEMSGMVVGHFSTYGPRPESAPFELFWCVDF